MVDTLKCQAADPNKCVDPQCPERRGVRQQMANATNFNEYAVAADKQKQDQVNQLKNKLVQQTAGAKPVLSPLQEQAKRSGETTREGDPVAVFHKDVYMPKNFTAPAGSREIIYSYHASQEQAQDQYGVIPKLARVNLDAMELIELKVNAKTGQVYRYLYRAELDDDKDICLVLQPAGKGRLLVVTNWLNEKSDAHKTLNRNKYAQPRVLVAA